MKHYFVAALFTTAAFLASGTPAWACNQVTATITDTSTGDEYAHGGILMVVDNNFANPIAGTDSELSGGQFSVTVNRNIGNAKAVVTLYRPEGKDPLPPIIRSIANMNNTPGVCETIVETVDGGVYTTMRGARGIIAF